MKHFIENTYIGRLLFKPLLKFLKHGITPEKLALTVTLGTLIGLFPVPGTTTAVCMLAALWLRLNMPAIQFVNYVLWPLQLLMIIPFIKAGEWLFGFVHLPLSLPEIQMLFENDWIEGIRTLWRSLLQGIAVWLLVSIPASFAIYYVVLPVLSRIVSIRNNNMAEPN